MEKEIPFAIRQRLMAHLDAAAQNNHIFLTGAAGSGKYVAVQLWIDNHDYKDFWINLDAYDNMPSVFYKQFVTQILASQPDNEGIKRLLSSKEFSASPVESSVRIISELYHDDTPFIFIFDNLHFIENNTILQSLPTILRRLPANYICVMLSRHMAPDSLLPLYARSAQSILQDKDLAFTEQEIAAYVAQYHKEVSLADISSLYEKTEGWALAVYEAAHHEIEILAQENPFDRYFEEHIWSTLPVQQQRVLADMAFLREIPLELMAILHPQLDCESIFDDLKNGQAFIRKIDGATYKLHPLFQNFLWHKQREVLDENILLTVAHFYAEKKLFHEALLYALRCTNPVHIQPFILAFIAQHSFYAHDYIAFVHLLMQDASFTHALESCPVVHIIVARYAHLTHQQQLFEKHLDTLYQQMPFLAEQSAEFLWHMLWIAFYDHRKNFEQKIELYTQIQTLLGASEPPSVRRNLTFVTHYAPIAHGGAVDFSQAILDIKNFTKLFTLYANMWGDSSTYWQNCILAGLAYEQNDFTQALSCLEKAKRDLPHITSFEAKFVRLFLLHAMYTRMGYSVMAKNTLEELKDIVNNEAPALQCTLQASMVKTQLQKGLANVAGAWIEQNPLHETEEQNLTFMYAKFTTIRALLVMREYERAEKILQSLIVFAEEFQRPLAYIEARTLCAILYWKQHQKERALQELIPALRKAQQYDYVRLLADEGVALLPLLIKLQRNKAHKGCVDTGFQEFLQKVILAAKNFSRNHKKYLITEKEQKEKTLKLSKRQVQILSLLKEGNSYGEICQKTGLKITTIKTHISLVYKKLDVHKKSEALAKAKALHLL